MTEPTPHFSLALEALAHLPLVEYDLLARELNVYSEALRQRGGRTNFSAPEIQTLFMRMWDVARITPERGHSPSPTSPVDLDSIADAMRKPTQVTKLRSPNGAAIPDPA